VITFEQILLILYLGLNSFINILVPISGSSTITSVLAILTEPQRAIAIATFFFLSSAPFRIYAFRKYIQWKEVKSLLPFSLSFAIIGIIFSLMIPTKFLLSLILIFTIYFLYKKIKLLKNEKEEEKKENKIISTFVGSLSGFLQGAGLGGSGLRNSYLFSKGLKIMQIHGTTSIVGGSTFLLSSIIRYKQGSLLFADIIIVLLILPISILAIYLGKHTLLKISKKTSNHIIIFVMSLVIIGLIIKLMT